MNILKIVAFEILIVSCGANSTVSTNNNFIDQQVLKTLLQDRMYDIPITGILNTDGTKTNLSPSTTMSNNGNISKSIRSAESLDDEYFIKVRPDAINFNLPYSGRTRSATIAYSSNESVSKVVDFNNLSYELTDTGKLNKITINLNEKIEGLKIVEIELDENGTARIRAYKIANQTVFYEGYIKN